MKFSAGVVLTQALLLAWIAVFLGNAVAGFASFASFIFYLILSHYEITLSLWEEFLDEEIQYGNLEYYLTMVKWYSDNKWL